MNRGGCVRRRWARFAVFFFLVGWSFKFAARAQEESQIFDHSPAPVLRTPPADNPVADPKAVVTIGHARFTVLTPQLIRMEWSADGKFEDHASLVFINRRLPVPKFGAIQNINGPLGSLGTITIGTSALRLTYNADAQGPFGADNLSVTLTVDGKQVTWHPGDTDPSNLQGTTRTLDGALGSKTQEPIEQGLISRSGWALVDDSTRPLFDSTDFRFLEGEKSPWPWVVERPANERPGAYVDWYLFGYGHDYRKALGDYVKVAGRIPLPPRFAFGVWWSRYWAYSDQELDELVRGFRENDTPLDVLVIDMDWHIDEEQLRAIGSKDQSGEQLGWTGYTWNKVLFPDPEAFLKKLHDQGLKVTMNLHPAAGIEPWEQAYPAMARAMGIDPATQKYIPFDVTDRQWTINYFNLVLHPLERQGVDFWWLDWQQWKTTSVPGLSPTWWLNYVHFTDQQREGKRPLLFHRWGGLGNHRYEIGFSGDTISVWDSLAFQPWFTATAANVGYAYWSHDIGGHMPGAVDPELYTRWVQFGAFSPVLRTHTTKNPESERRIWAYPEPYSSVLRSAYQLRYSLVPYIYTEARRTYDTGVAFFRPVYYDWPHEVPAYGAKNEYLFGDEMLVAPVVEPVDRVTHLAEEKIWLPAGRWYEWPTGKRLDGEGQADRSFTIDEIPVFVKTGAIVPMQPAALHASEKPVDPLIVNVWPLDEGQTSSYAVYEDSGVSVEYQRGVFARMPVRATQNGDVLRVEIGPVVGSYPGMLTTRSYELRLPADWPPQQVMVNGVPVRQAGADGKGGWRFEGNTLTTVIPVPSSSVRAKVTIEVRRAAGSTARRGELDGFAGAMTRLRAAYDALQNSSPVAGPPDALIAAMQTGDRLSYHPESAQGEMAHFREAVKKAEAAVQAMEGPYAARLDQATHIGGANLAPLDLEAEKQKRLDLLKRAEAMVGEAGK
jgi:alpha-glucosidase